MICGTIEVDPLCFPVVIVGICDKIKQKFYLILQVRVISNPDERNEGGCTLVSTCDGAASFGIETSGRLEASFKNEPDGERTCQLRGWNFDIPYADTFNHGQILVQIKGIIQQQPPIKIFGIADTSMKTY